VLALAAQCAALVKMCSPRAYHPTISSFLIFSVIRILVTRRAFGGVKLRRCNRIKLVLLHPVGKFI
jgi:hypothetical protein